MSGVFVGGALAGFLLAVVFFAFIDMCKPIEQIERFNRWRRERLARTSLRDARIVDCVFYEKNKKAEVDVVLNDGRRFRKDVESKTWYSFPDGEEVDDVVRCWLWDRVEAHRRMEDWSKEEP